ncbi:MAG: polysaccharide biosynthesis/export family protein [Planctomycetes bacterium]|nr:polysaccharide biosynthesis/export family protein [Planctomycetota bacterium]
MFLVVVVLGCNEEGKKTSRPPSFQDLAAKAGQEKGLLQRPRSLSADYLENDYIIGSEDVLDIKVFGAAEFDRKVMVSITGYIGFPYLGNIKVAGFTLADLEFTLAWLLKEKKYLKDPQVSVFVSEYDSKKVTVLGEVGKPQVLKLRKNSSTLFEVLGEVGGINASGGKALYVIRSAPAQALLETNASIPASGVGLNTNGTGAEEGPGEEKIMVQMQDTVIPIQIADLLEYRNPAANIEILPGDVITVPRGQFFFILGEVASPGGYQIKEGMTALQSLSMGGKFSPTYKPSDIKLVRRESDGSTSFTTLDFKKISRGEEDDIAVLPGDVFIVGKSPAKTVALQILELGKGATNVATGAMVWQAVSNK